MQPSSTIHLGSIQAAQYSEQVPDGDLLDLHLFPSERFPLSCFIQERCSYWMAEIQRRIHECTAINQAFLREVFVLGYQSAAVRGDRCVNICVHSQRGAHIHGGAVVQLFAAVYRVSPEFLTTVQYILF